MIESRIKKNVMRRIYLARVMRPLMSDRVLALGVAALAILGLGHEVFVAQVYRNMPAITDIVALSKFFSVAFLKTDLLVQILVVLVLGASFWAMRDAVGILARPPQRGATV